jgi:lysophospholipase L1-like esterase
MSRLYEVARGALLLGAAGAVLASCDDNGAAVLGPAPADNLFASYVAIGNSITAGYQSGGINDSTQQQSFALLLARQMHTRYAYPALAMPGCPPPINNTLAGTRVTPTGQPPSTATTCVLRTPASATAVLNNVAVPGFATADPTQTGTNAPSRNTLAQLFLGGKSMIAKALDAQPTFATVWIGNNDILQPALGGFPAGATPLATFTANYSAMINDLIAGAPALKGVLIGVVQVSGVPLLFQAGVIDASPAVRGAASQVAGRPVGLDPITCAGTGAGALVNFQYLAAIRSRPPGLPGTVYCQKIFGGGANDPGDNGILDVTEQAGVTGLINSYNAYIEAKADSIGFAYYDPNVAFATLKQSGAIPPFPNLASTTATFGQYISLDGVHPAAAAHKLLANELIDVINAKYGTHLIAAP